MVPFDTLFAIPRKLNSMKKKRLGELLRDRGQLSAENLSKALDEHHQKLVLLGEVLLQRGYVDRPNLITALEEVTKVPYVDCRSLPVEPEVLKLIPRATAVRFCVLPLQIEKNRLVVAMAEPQNVQILTELSFVAGKGITPHFAFRAEILAAIEDNYGGFAEARPKSLGTSSAPLDSSRLANVEFNTEGGVPSDELQAELKSSPAVSLVSNIIASAASKDASDIHMEPTGQGLVVRLRIDGILRELTTVPEDLRHPVISRIKVLADLDIAERRKPQDGRVVTQIASKRLDLRISVLPTHRGEKIVIRLLDPAAPKLRFPDLGMAPSACDALSRLLERPQGMILVTGPTGSGKTTTLYAALHQLRSPGVNITTVEDPVEYMLEGANQVQVNTKAGLTFAGTLRSILRQDPNVIMVGEIRDGETAEIALKAAQTGHFVLTTVHTNDSIAAIARLIDLQVTPFLIASSVTAVLSQRLARKLCSCCQRVPATPEYTAQLASAGVSNPEGIMYIPTGCPLCEDLGFRGRVGIFEMMLLDDSIRACIRKVGGPDELRAIASGTGMKSMQEDAMEKVRDGLTTLQEVLRVVPFEESSSGSRCLDCGRTLAETFLFCPYCGNRRATSELETTASRRDRSAR
jgi:type IV pilus assembly protein PilB